MIEEQLNGTDQPCQTFKSVDISPYTDSPQPHQCPLCHGWRYFCDICVRDHHEFGWDYCKARQSESPD